MCGIKKNFDINNLTENDFYILDPWKDEKASWKTQKKKCRKLLRGADDVNHKSTAKKRNDEGYLLYIYNDPQFYLDKSNELTKPINI